MTNAPKILLVDDDKIMHKLLEQVLLDQNYEIDNAYTVDEAIKKLKNRDYDAAIFDIMIGERNGVEILKFVKNGKNLVKIMVTGSPNVENAINSLNFGADAYFTKPFNANEFLSTLKTKLSEKSGNKQFVDDKLNHWLEQRLNSVYKEV